MSLQPTKTLIIKPDFYSNQDVNWILELCLEYLHEKGVLNPTHLGFEIHVEYLEEEEA